MDKIIKVVLGLFIVILILFVSIVSYMTYVDTMYRNSLSSTYQYTCTISTEGVLSNVTLFLPVPADIQGNSPVIARISSHDISGVPANWNLTLFDTGKGTLLQVVAPVMGSAQAAVVTLTVNASSPVRIDTGSPVTHAAVFRPVQGIQATACPAGDTAATGNPSCYQYQTSLYADYTAAPTASLAVSATVTGTNAWSIFSPASNEYQNTLSISTLHGENHGWVTALGGIEAGIGSYDVPTS